MKEGATDAGTAGGLAAGTGFRYRLAVGVCNGGKGGVGLAQDGGLVELMPAQRRHPQWSRQGL